MNWIKTHPRAFCAYLGLGFVAAGLLTMIPRSPWTLVVIGVSILFCVFVSLMPADRSPR